MKALIFDVDGTPAETEELHRRAFNEAFAAAGLDWSWDRDRYRVLLGTTGGKERIARFIADEGLDASLDIPALHADKTARYTTLMSAGAIEARPGVQALIEAAAAAGLRVAVATTTSRPNVEALSLALFGKAAGEVFDVIAAGDEVAAKKPAPDVYLLALERLGIGPEDAVAFEDSLNGLRSAKAAGLACVVAPGAYTMHEDLSPADLLVADLSQVALPDLTTLRRRAA